MLEGLEQTDVNNLKAVLAERIHDLAMRAADKKGQNCSFEYGRMMGLIEAADMISAAQEGDL